MPNLQPLYLTLHLATITTIILFILALPLSYWLAYSRSQWRIVIEAIIALPLVLPPVVLGFYLLLLFGQEGILGKILSSLAGWQLVFTFEGLVVASIIYSFPFMVHPLQNGFQSLPSSLREVSYVLGKSRWQTLYLVLLPNMKSSIVSGIVLSFAHTVGEFGVVLMIGGSIPGQTRVVSIAIYDQVQALDYAAAHVYSLILTGMSFLVLLVVYFYNRKGKRNHEIFI